MAMPVPTHAINVMTWHWWHWWIWWKGSKAHTK